MFFWFLCLPNNVLQKSGGKVAAYCLVESYQKLIDMFSIGDSPGLVACPIREKIVKWLTRKVGKPTSADLRDDVQFLLKDEVPQSLMQKVYDEYNIGSDTAVLYALPSPLPQGLFLGRTTISSI